MFAMLFKQLALFWLSATTTGASLHGHDGAQHSHRSIHAHARRAASSKQAFEYVIVGSGAGGGPLACRLAMAGHSVLLIEAGDDQGDSYEERVPAWQLNAQVAPKMAWDFYVNHYDNLTRQAQDSKMTYKLPDGELYVGLDPPADAEPLGILYPRSGTLGGCGSHNAMVMVYPFESDWE
jgi:choline dehydrogenase